MPQVLDTEKRLNILFDHLNNEDLLKPDTVQEMVELSNHIQARRYDEAQALFTELMKNKNDEGSNWMVSQFLAPGFYGICTDKGTGWCQAPNPNEQSDPGLKKWRGVGCQ